MDRGISPELAAFYTDISTVEHAAKSSVATGTKEPGGGGPYLEYTLKMMVRNIILLEDHLANIANDIDVGACLACSYWHTEKLIAYDSLERVKFDPEYDTRFLRWCERFSEDLKRMDTDRELAAKALLHLREWRYHFAGDVADLPSLEDLKHSHCDSFENLKNEEVAQ